jgi:hemolysin activation/secretion protein
VEGSAADQAARLSDWNAPEESDAGALGVWLKTGHVLFDDYIYRGISFETVAYWYDRAFGGDTSFLKMQGDLRFYVPLQWRTNFTGKLFVGYENSDNFIEQYALGGLDTMRGYPDRRYRGQGASYLNLEFRWLAASWWWFSFMFVGLADAGATWNNGVENYYLADNLLTSLGGGLRLIVNKWDYAVIRLDAAWPFATQGPIGITFGMDMFF